MTDTALLQPSPATQQVRSSDRHLALGAAAMMAANIGKFGIQFAMLPVMARLLGPEAFGLYALASPTIAFILMLADGGLGNSLARERLEAHDVWSSAFWAVHGFALFLVGVVIAWSFLLAYVTSQPRLPPLMAALSISLFFLASGVLPGARLLRRGALHVGAGADLTANVLGAGLGISLAFRGAGAWALVGQFVITFAIRASIMNVAAFAVPALTFHFSSLRPHLLFGGSIVATKLVEYAGRITENTLITTTLGASALGIYGFANQLSQFLCESASNPLWAILYVQAVQKPQDVAIRAYYGITRALGIVLFPLCFVAAVGSSHVVGLFLGPAWRVAALPLSILLLTCPFQVFGGLTYALLYAKGRGDIPLWLGSGRIIGRLMGVLMAIFIGLDGVTVAVGLCNVVYGIVTMVVAARVIGFSPVIVLRGLLAPLVCALGASAACEVLVILVGGQNLILVLGGLLAFLIYAGLLIILDRHRLVHDITVLHGLMKRKSPA